MVEAGTTSWLTTKEQNIVMIASCTASGDAAKLESTIQNGLDEGLTVNEIKEVLIQLYAYLGFPRSLNGLAILLKLTKVKNYPEGIAGEPLARGSDLHSIGAATQTQLTGREVKGELFDFAPAIDAYLKEHLFGDIFARGVLSWRERELATIAALASLEGVESQLDAHVQIGKHNGLSDKQISEILMLTSRPKATVFAIGDLNLNYAKYFKGNSYLKILSNQQVHVANVTFEPKCRNNWHIHHGGGQILLVTGGRGYYQKWGREAQKLKRGDVVNIPPETKHWHGAAKDSWFAHVAIEVPCENGTTEWLEEVSDQEYDKLR